MGFSGGVPIDWEGSRAESSFQNRRDLVGAKRRPLQALVGRLYSYPYSISSTSNAFDPDTLYSTLLPTRTVLRDPVISLV